MIVTVRVTLPQRGLLQHWSAVGTQEDSCQEPGLSLLWNEQQKQSQAGVSSMGDAQKPGWALWGNPSAAVFAARAALWNLGCCFSSVQSNRKQD